MNKIRSDWVQPDFSKNYQDNFKNLGLLILRLGIGAMMLFGHGVDKLVNFSDKAVGFPDPLGFGPAVSLGLTVFAEVVCSTAIAFGFLTRLSTIPLIIMTLVAAFVIHGDDPWNRKELAIMYMIPFIVILFTGAGRYSIDYLWFNKDNN